MLDRHADGLDDAACIDSEDGGPGPYEEPVGVLLCVEWVQGYGFGADAYFVPAGDRPCDGDVSELALWGGELELNCCF